MTKRCTYAKIGLVGILGCLGCRTDDIYRRNWHVPLTGVVRDASGNPVPGAIVSYQTFDLIGGAGPDARGKCTNGYLLPATNTQASLVGRFSFSIVGAGAESRICVFVDASAVVGGRFVTGSVEVDSVHIGPYDLQSLDIDVTVRP